MHLNHYQQVLFSEEYDNMQISIHEICLRSATIVYMILLATTHSNLGFCTYRYHTINQLHINTNVLASLWHFFDVL